MLSSQGVKKSRTRTVDPSERKRAIYVQRACFTCRGRKVRCDGGHPCGPCEKRLLECVYSNNPPDDRQRRREPWENELSPQAPPLNASSGPSLQDWWRLNNLVSSLQGRVNALESCQPDRDDHNTTVHHLQLSSAEVRTVPKNTPSSEPDFAASFEGPTSANFSIGLAKLILEHGARKEKMDTELAGLATDEDENDPNQSLGGDNLVRPQHFISFIEARRLIHVYQAVLGILHPIVDIEFLLNQVEFLYEKGGYITQPPCDHADIDEICILKMVVAVALLAEGGGSSTMALALYESLELPVARASFARVFTVRGQLLLLMAAFFHMFHDDFRLASRFVAIASRIMIEAGLNRKQVLRRRFPRPEEQKNVVILLCTQTILDRSLNFNAGLPFTLKDADVEIPEMDLPPYVKAMVSYVHFGADAWAAVTDESGRIKAHFREDDYEFLKYQVRCWQASLPEDLQPRKELAMNEGTDAPLITESDRATFYLRSILYLRANQIQILVLRPLLFSPQSVRTEIKLIVTTAQIAKDSIDKMVEMNKYINCCRQPIPLISQFLASALSTLFLVYIYSLPQQHLENVGELSATLPLVKDGILAGLGVVQSHISNRSCQRLWNKFAGSRGLLERLGLNRTPGVVDPSITAMFNPAPITRLDGEPYQIMQWHNDNCIPPGVSDMPGGDFMYSSAPHALEGLVHQEIDYGQITGRLPDNLFPSFNVDQILTGNDFDVFFDGI